MALESYSSGPGGRAADTVPSSPSAVPSSSVEVTIRTLDSDIDLMGKGGGTMPTPERVSIELTNTDVSLRAPQAETPAFVPPTYVPPPSAPLATRTSTEAPGAAFQKTQIVAPKQSSLLLYLIGGVVGAAILFAIGFFVYPLFVPESVPVEPRTPPAARSTTTPVTLPQPDGTTRSHKSFFTKPAELVAWNMDSATGTASQALALFLKNAAQGVSFLEVAPQRNNGSFISWIDFAPRIQSILAQGFFQENFETDFTMFVYRDAKKSYPGYILKLSPGKLPILLQKEAQKIESTPSAFADLFLDPPGAPSGTFKDGQIGGQPTRTVSFTPSGAKFIYGWFGSGYFIMSTSEEGLKQAAARL